MGAGNRVALIAGAAVFLFGCGSSEPAHTAARTPAKPPTAVKPSPQEVGRYQIVFSPHARADTYLLDTETGRVWVMTQFTDLKGKPTAWNLTDRLDNFADMDVFAALHGPIEKTPSSAPPPPRKTASSASVRAKKPYPRYAR
ncbi:MAG TPA: hypothetical protein VMU08_12040 [Rhizomicrobium sp.]|nr:hypothetical protein [Rhizomicrobium sp.]